MIAELVAGGAALLVTASGWIAAWRARGSENDAHAGRRLAEVRADVEQAKTANAIADRDAARGELKAATIARDTYKQQLQAERAEKVALLERLAKAGAAIGPDVLDSAIDRLHANPSRIREDPAGGNTGDHGGSVPDHDPNASEPIG